MCTVFGKEMPVRFLQTQLRIVLKPYLTFPLEPESSEDGADGIRRYVLKVQWNGDGNLELRDRLNKDTGKSSYVAVYAGQEYVLDGSTMGNRIVGRNHIEVRGVRMDVEPGHWQKVHCGLMTASDVKEAGGITDTLDIIFSEDGNKFVSGSFQRYGEGPLSLRAIRMDKGGVPIASSHISEEEEGVYYGRIADILWEDSSDEEEEGVPLRNSVTLDPEGNYD